MKWEPAFQSHIVADDNFKRQVVERITSLMQEQDKRNR
jgi:hypothetical protein